jgi:protein involved in polysaccharide export with SLBB domain
MKAAMMRSIGRWLTRMLFGLALAAPCLAQQAGSGSSPAAPENAVSNVMSTYRLGSGDVISIRVFGEEDFTREKIRLNDAGTVSFPVLGEIPVNGQTVSAIEKMITDRLRGRILVNPRVTVWIEEYRPFFVNGMVERPGAYPYQPGLNVRKAVSIAGGFKERASMNKIFVVREKDPAAKMGKVDLNSEIGPGDSITVEESFF